MMNKETAGMIGVPDYAKVKNGSLKFADLFIKHKTDRNQFDTSSLTQRMYYT